jgi:hypothetical protein
MALPATLLGCSKGNYFEDERICIHIFNRQIQLPEPLFERYKNAPSRTASRNYFQIGLPELMVCTTTKRFVDMVQYFWPISRQEFQELQKLIFVRFKISEITSQSDVNEFSKYLYDEKEILHSKSINNAIIFTLNDYTKYWSTDLIDLWRKSSIEEFVIFKDPARAPYLCEYPSLQKGFKRPPP